MFGFRRKLFCCCVRPRFHGCCCPPMPCRGHFGCDPYDPYMEGPFRPRRRRARSRRADIRELEFRRRGRDFDLDFNEEDLEDDKDY